MPITRPRAEDVRIFDTAADFRGWLEPNHESADALFVGYYKKGVAKQAMTYPQAVEEALCHGWIDGITFRIDDELTATRFTPRRKGSSWSAVNIAKMAELKAAGRLHAAGLRAFEERDRRKDASYSYERPPLELEAEMLARLQADSSAWEHWQAEQPSYGVYLVLRRLPQSEPRTAWMDQLAAWREVSEARSWHGSGAWREGRLSADYVVDQIGEATNHQATLVSDVGQNQMWAARYFGFRHPYRHLSSGGLGTMGYAVPAAMGAALGAPERETWAIVGDGGFQMTMQELATLVQDQIPVRIAVLNNHRLGMIRQWQEIIYDENYHSAELLGPDLLRLCEAYGIPAWRATRPDEVAGVIAEARKAPGPALIDFHLDEAQNVYPMMLPGKGLSDMVEGAPE